MVRSRWFRGRRLAVAVTTSTALLTASVLTQPWSAPAADAAGVTPFHIVRVTPSSERVYPSAPALTVTFNQPPSLASVHYATAVDDVTRSWSVVSNPTVARTASADAVRLDLGAMGPGAYAVIIGPAALSADGLALGRPYVFNFVIGPESHTVAWQRISEGGTTYTVWVTGPAAAPAAVAGDLLTTRGRQVLFGGEPVSAVYATSGSGTLVMDPALSQQLLLDAEETAFASIPTHPAANFIQAADAAWAHNNGPGSDLATALYDAAKGAGLGPEAAPSRQSVYETAIASGLAEGGAPGQWGGEAASDTRTIEDALDAANVATEAAHIVTDLLKEGHISIPGAEVLGPLVRVIGAAKLGVAGGGAAASQLFQAQWDAAAAAAAAGPLNQIAGATTDHTVRSAIADMVHFNPSTVQARIDDAFLHSLAQDAYGTILPAVTKAVADAGDPMADAILTGIDIGFFLADFTGWDVVRAGLYQAAYESDAESAVSAAAAALQKQVASSAAPSADLAGAEVLAVRLQYAIAGDFYQTATAIATKTQWTQLIDGPLARYVFHSSTPSQEAGAWSRDVRSDPALAAELLPGAGAATVDPSALLTVAANFPVAAPGVQIIHECGFRITEPGLYALPQYLWSPSSDACTSDGIDIASPGVGLTFNGFNLVGGDGAIDGVHILPGASGALVSDGTITGSGWGTGVAVDGTGALLTHLILPIYSVGGVVLNHGDGAVVRNDQFGSNASTGMYVSMTNTMGATVEDNAFSGISQPAEIGLVKSSGNNITDNTFSMGQMEDGVYVGCAPGETNTSVAHPLTHTSCSPASTGNVVEGNRITMSAGSGPAIVLDNDARDNTVERNTVLGVGSTYALWDFSTCGVNHWADNSVKAASDSPSSGFFPSNNPPCVR